VSYCDGIVGYSLFNGIKRIMQRGHLNFERLVYITPLYPDVLQLYNSDIGYLIGAGTFFIAML